MVGPGELILILIVVLGIVLVVRGPKVLPQFGEAIGKTIKGLRQNLKDDDEPEDAAKLDPDAVKPDPDKAAKPEDAAAPARDDADTKSGD